ncbi:MAG: nitroreductase [Bacteroidia bacterium]|nr:nitroreductase [Bacteroidia bacterium]
MKNPNLDFISKIIRERRAIFPSQFNGNPINKKTLQLLLENANWAPTHKRTEPWRFHVITGSGLDRLGKYLAEKYREDPKGGVFSEMKYKKTKAKATQSSAVIAIVMHLDPKASIPEWEEIAATSMAVQNLWLSCAAAGIGTYWSSPSLFTKNNTFLNLEQNEKCLGLMYLGYYDDMELTGKRKPIEDKVTWIDQ